MQVFPTIEGGLGPLYPVVDHVEWIAKLLPLGVKTVQLRIKDPQQDDLEQQVIDAIELGRKYHAQVYINDYWQLAIEHGAYGIHLGQEDLDQANLSQIHAAGLRLGVSTRTVAELDRGLSIQPSYLAIGHIFPTPTKQMPTPPQGVAQLAKHLKTVNGAYPTVAIGGIDLTNVDDVFQTGVDAIAVVRAITHSEDVAATVAAFNEKLNR